MYKVSFSPEAVDDIKEIKQYIKDELSNEQAAKNTVAKILKSIRMLSKFPESGASLSAIIGFDSDYRYLVCGNYLAFYRIENETVLIVRIAYSDAGFKYFNFVNAEDEADFNEYIETCKSLQLYETDVDSEYCDKLITLSTCEYSRTDGRIVVVAKLVDNTSLN